MQSNVVVLTIGWTGSSVLTNLIARGGFSTGDETVKKPDYDTFENLELTQLNRQLIRDSGCSINYAVAFSWKALATVASAADRIDLAVYRAFLERLAGQKPWVWKDPRLWLTIRFWQRLMDFSDVKFVWLTRDDLQSWISANIRRQIISYRYCKLYNQQVNSSIEAFLEINALPYLRLSFEDLVVRPAPTLDRLNRFLSVNLRLDDLRAVYDKPLYRKARGVKDLLLAGAIYAKNYSARIDSSRIAADEGTAAEGGLGATDPGQ